MNDNSKSMDTVCSFYDGLEIAEEDIRKAVYHIAAYTAGDRAKTAGIVGVIINDVLQSLMTGEDNTIPCLYASAPEMEELADEQRMQKLEDHLAAMGPRVDRYLKRARGNAEMVLRKVPNHAALN